MTRRHRRQRRSDKDGDIDLFQFSPKPTPPTPLPLMKALKLVLTYRNLLPDDMLIGHGDESSLNAFFSITGIGSLRLSVFRESSGDTECFVPTESYTFLKGSQIAGDGDQSLQALPDEAFSEILQEISSCHEPDRIVLMSWRQCQQSWSQLEWIFRPTDRSFSPLTGPNPLQHRTIKGAVTLSTQFSSDLKIRLQFLPTSRPVPEQSRNDCSPLREPIRLHAKDYVDVDGDTTISEAYIRSQNKNGRNAPGRTMIHDHQVARLTTIPLVCEEFPPQACNHNSLESATLQTCPLADFEKRCKNTKYQASRQAFNKIRKAFLRKPLGLSRQQLISSFKTVPGRVLDRILTRLLDLKMIHHTRSGTFRHRVHQTILVKRLVKRLRPPRPI